MPAFPQGPHPENFTSRWQARYTPDNAVGPDRLYYNTHEAYTADEVARVRCYAEDLVPIPDDAPSGWVSEPYAAAMTPAQPRTDTGYFWLVQLPNGQRYETTATHNLPILLEMMPNAQILGFRETLRETWTTPTWDFPTLISTLEPARNMCDCNGCQADREAYAASMSQTGVVPDATITGQASGSAIPQPIPNGPWYHADWSATPDPTPGPLHLPRIALEGWYIEEDFDIEHDPSVPEDERAPWVGLSANGHRSWARMVYRMNGRGERCDPDVRHRIAAIAAAPKTLYALTNLVNALASSSTSELDVALRAARAAVIAADTPWHPEDESLTLPNSAGGVVPDPDAI